MPQAPRSQLAKSLHTPYCSSGELNLFFGLNSFPELNLTRPSVYLNLEAIYIWSGTFCLPQALAFFFYINRHLELILWQQSQLPSRVSVRFPRRLCPFIWVWDPRLRRKSDWYILDWWSLGTSHILVWENCFFRKHFYGLYKC